MAKCTKIVNNKRLVCIGAMKHSIAIIARAIETLSVGYTMDFSNTTTVFAAIKTKKGTPVFNGVNIEQELTHVYYIRAGYVTVENNYTIFFNNKYYKVIDFEDMEEEHRFIGIISVERGLSSNKANWA